MNDRTLYWLEIAEYDLETARAMLETGRYLYVGFMCHQVIEKGFKAAIASRGDNTPYIHNLSRLAEKAGLYEQLSPEQKDFIDALEPLNVQARYPDEKKELAAAMTPGGCETMLTQTRDLFQWIRATL